MSDVVRKTYDSKATAYDETFRRNFFKVYDAVTWKYLEPYLPRDKDALVLDAGGGTGRWSIPIAKKGLNVVLVDISEGMLNVAKTKTVEAGLEEKITVKQGDIAKLEYPDETFDLILCEHVLFLIEEPLKAIQELVRVLKKKHPLIVSIPNTYCGLLMCLRHDFSANTDEAAKWLNGSFSFIKEDEKSIKGRGLTPTEFRKRLDVYILSTSSVAESFKNISSPLGILTAFPSD